ncbi:C-C motif chemokine 20 [Salminus brasiliensis]|uniref:C-C motif chemokine 20 n=1 Tax=Salminus brasiliensis TaxID=930266 RepID=UPI003B836F17
MSAKGLVAIAFVACWLLCTLCPTSAAYGPQNHACCVKYTRKPLDFKLIKGYIEQSSREVCRIDAIIFLTKRNKKVCASSADEWVKVVLRRLSDKMKKMSNQQPDRAATSSVSMLSAGSAPTSS